MASKPKLDAPGKGNHKEFVDNVEERFQFYRDLRQPSMANTIEAWDLYLTKRREFRAKGEEWRANMALPDAFAGVEAKVANLVAIMLGADPMVQPEGVFDESIESARSVERLLDYTYRKNQFSKSLVKLIRAKEVAGTSFFKLTWTERVHTVTLTRDPSEIQQFNDTLQGILGSDPGLIQPPDWMTEPEAFEQWRSTVNTAGRGKIPSPPVDGPQQFVLYRGPQFNQLPLTSVYLDPTIDEIAAQNFIVYRTVKPMSWLEKAVAKGIYDKAAVEFGLEGWDGRVAEEEEVELSRRMEVNTDSAAAADPYYSKAVELWEVWQPGSEVPYALVLNRKSVINLNPFEMPFIHGEVGIGCTRGVVVPGSFYGMSALTPAKDLFWEKRKLRNLRLDAVTLNVLPAFTRLKEVGLPEMMHKIRPGAVIPVSRPDAISALIRQPLPPEAYREPAELDIDIADSLGVYGSTKGRDAQIGRVTGTEFQGRENRAQIRFKLDSIFLEEDLYPLNRQMIAMWAQMSKGPLRLKVGGNPDPFIEIDRGALVEAMEQQWRFRGPNKAVNRDMQVQQLMMWVKTFGATLTPTENRFAAKLVLDLLDVRGSSRLVSDAGTAQKVQEYQAAQQAALAQQGAAAGQAAASQVPAPSQVDASQAAAIQGGQQ